MDTPGEASQAVAPSDLGRARVLVVDDIEANRDLLTRRLRRMGISSVAEATNGEQALAALRRERFDLVLLDLMMPVLNGYEVLETLYREGRTSELAVVVLSALSEIDSVVRCIELGAEDFVFKPFNPTLLRARVTASLEKKFLRDATRRELERRKAELREARALQLSLVPPPLEEDVAAGRIEIDLALEPAKEIGGDLVDHFRVGDRLHVLVLGDVSDKGAGAALVMARTHALVRGLAGRPDAAELFAAPGAALAVVNRALAVNNESCMFVTLLLAAFDLVEFRLDYASAGHVPPFLARSGGGIERLDRAGGVPLGLLETATYDTESVHLAAGDRLLVVTDGITEASSPDGALFGSARVAEWLTRRRPVADLVETILDHEGGAPRSDDIAAILLTLGEAA
ncbi:MAG TPA: fused response regulator/phosphatase [Stellaceae bacterium]|nr:fused response regulator/phosphatase [Stellaceae bacterium]